MVKETNKSIATDFYKTGNLPCLLHYFNETSKTRLHSQLWLESSVGGSQSNLPKRGGGGITLLRQCYPPQFFITTFMNGLSHHSMATWTKETIVSTPLVPHPETKTFALTQVSVKLFGELNQRTHWPTSKISHENPKWKLQMQRIRRDQIEQYISSPTLDLWLLLVLYNDRQFSLLNHLGHLFHHLQQNRWVRILSRVNSQLMKWATLLLLTEEPAYTKRESLIWTIKLITLILLYEHMKLKNNYFN